MNTLKLIIKRTLPLSVGILSIFMVQLVDSIFIGQLGTNELTIQGITQPFSTILVGFQVGLGIAATSVISKALGEKSIGKATAVASISLVVGNALVVSVCFGFWLFREHVFSTFITESTSAESLHLIYNGYWPLWLISSVFGGALYFISTVYRAYGETKAPGFILVLSSLLNLLLDPILIFSLDMGIKGAAVASTISFFVCFIFMLIRAIPKRWFSLVVPSKINHQYLRELLTMTISTTANQMLPAICAFLTMLLISTMGNNSIALWNILSKIEMFLLVFSLSLTMSVPPIIGRYLGERNESKIYELSVTITKLILAVHLLLALLVAICADLVVPLLTNDTSLSHNIRFAFWTLPISYGPLGLCMVVVSQFNALGLPIQAMCISFVRLFVLYLPAIFIGTTTEDMTYVVIAASIANILGGFFSWLQLRHYLKTRSNFDNATRRGLKEKLLS